MFTRVRWVLGFGVASLLVASACSTSGEKQAGDIADADTAVPTTAKATEGPLSTPKVTSTPAPTATPAPKDLVVLESGFTYYNDSSGNIVAAWAAVVENPSELQAMADPQVTALFYDDAGVLLKTDQAYVGLIMPGKNNAVGGSYVSLTAKPARLELRVKPGQYADAFTSPISFAVTDVAYVPDRYSPKITGKVSNPTTKDVSKMAVTCVMVAPDGRYAAISTAFVDLVPAAATAVASCSVDSRMTIPDGSTPRLYAGFANITKVGE